MLRMSELTHTLKSINMIKIWKYRCLYIKQNSTSITRNWFRKHIWLIRGAENWAYRNFDSSNFGSGDW